MNLRGCFLQSPIPLVHLGQFCLSDWQQQGLGFRSFTALSTREPLARGLNLSTTELGPSPPTLRFCIALQSLSFCQVGQYSHAHIADGGVAPAERVMACLTAASEFVAEVTPSEQGTS